MTNLRNGDMSQKDEVSMLPALIEKHHAKLLDEWGAAQLADGALRGGQMKEGELKAQLQKFLAALRTGATSDQLTDISGAAWDGMRDVLEDVSRSRALQGFSTAETATFVFSLKQPLFTMLRNEFGHDGQKLADEIWTTTLLLDKLGLYTTEVYQKAREEVIGRQQQELLELSTPVVTLWDGVLALPLIGTLDSARTQIVMESLLEEIVRSGAEIAIIDITGVPTVDTLVAQHLLKTVSAARLMGADCIISGIRPQIAQTMVHLGLDLNVVSKATLADAFALALRRMNKRITDRVAPTSPTHGAL
jgi:rsbT co-antagonist protein RsbR